MVVTAANDQLAQSVETGTKPNEKCSDKKLVMGQC